jgi:hypothetical protein
MKTLFLVIGIAAACVCFGPSAQAQYKGARDYFPKNPPPPTGGGGALPGAPKAPDAQPPAKPAGPKFKDVAVNSDFYFLSDTNRVYPWTKLSATTAKNTKNGVVQTINGESPVRK